MVVDFKHFFQNGRGYYLLAILKFLLHFRFRSIEIILLKHLVERKPSLIDVVSDKPNFSFPNHKAKSIAVKYTSNNVIKKVCINPLRVVIYCTLTGLTVRNRGPWVFCPLFSIQKFYFYPLIDSRLFTWIFVSSKLDFPNNQKRKPTSNCERFLEHLYHQW